MKTRTRVILACAGVLIVGAGVTFDAVLRSAASDALGGVLETTGVDAALSPTPMLIQLVSGSIGATLTVSESTLADLVECTSELVDPEVQIDDAGVTVSLTRDVAGISLPVEVLVVPARVDDVWVLLPESIAVAGIAIPADRAAALVGDGAQASVMSDGIPLPHSDSLVVTGATTGADLLTLDVAVSVPPPGDGERSTPSALSCLTTPTPLGDSS